MSNTTGNYENLSKFYPELGQLAEKGEKCIGTDNGSAALSFRQYLEKLITEVINLYNIKYDQTNKTLAQKN